MAPRTVRADAYQRVNRYRPAFDVLARMGSGAPVAGIYEAYLPLVESYQIVRGDSDLRFIRTGGELSLPGKRPGDAAGVSMRTDRSG